MERKDNTGNQGSAGKAAEGHEEKQSPTSSREIRGSAEDLSFPETSRRSSGVSREKVDPEGTLNKKDNSDEGLEVLQREEMTGSSEEDIRSVSYSDTDEDEDEGLGDGNLGRTVRDV